MSPDHSVRAQLERIYRAGLAAVDAGEAVRRAVVRHAADLEIAGERIPGHTPIRLLAAGKAAAAMAEAALDAAGEKIASGLVVTRDGHAAGHALGRLRVLEAAHPVPDARCERAAEAALDLAGDGAPGDVLWVLLSGGASALLSAPAPGVTLDDLARVNALLLACGADILETNVVRKHLSRISGGRLARHAAAERIVVLAVSDVPGDLPDVIGSGPVSADPSRYADAIDVMQQRGIWDRAPESVREHLERGRAGEHDETPKPGDASFEGVRYEIVASNRDARRAACAAARDLGWHAVDLGEVLQGEARVAAQRLVSLAASLGEPRPTCLVAGGETSVVVRGDGVGGRSQELALACAVTLAERARRGGASVPSELGILAAGTDGSDGPTDAAGAWADAGTVGRGAERGVSAAAALAANDSHGFFSREGGLLVTGPTGTNVMDLVLVAVGSPGESPPR